MEPTVKIGFFGCGNVGSGVWKLLTGFSKEISHRTGLHFEVKRALVRDVHKKREIELPEGVLVLTAGVDTQDDRMEYEIVGHGHFGETWGIEKGIVMGRPDDDAVWAQLDELVFDRALRTAWG